MGNTTNNYFYNLPIELQDRVHRAVFLADFHANKIFKYRLALSEVWSMQCIYNCATDIPDIVDVNAYYTAETSLMVLEMELETAQTERLANFTRDHHCRLFMPDQFKRYAILSLRALLTMNELPTDGSKQQLIARLMAL